MSKGAPAPRLLQEWLDKQNLRQTEAAKLLDVSQSIFSDWVKGKKTPRIDAAVRIERVTDGAVPVTAWLAAEDEDAAPESTRVGPGEPEREVG